MKKVLLLIGVVCIIGGAVAITATAASTYLSKNTEGSSGSCQGVSSQNHTLTITNDTASTNHIAAKYCDTLTVINRDDRLRSMAFGVHDQHRAYAGVTEKILAQDQSFTVTLDEIGSFLIHDHQQESVGSSFTVTN
jgi:hypothetical protein